MSWSFRLGEIVGIEFRIHVTFLLLLVFIYASAYSQKGSAYAVRAVLFISAVFACVLIHELGHSTIARHFDKGSRYLLPTGWAMVRNGGRLETGHMGGALKPG